VTLTPTDRSARLIAGIGGGTRNGAVALADGRGLLAVCSQERVTRVRGAGLNPSGLPDEAMDLLLRQLGRSRTDIARLVVADNPGGRRSDPSCESIDHHLAHACTAYLTSPYTRAAIVVCDHELPGLSVYVGEGATIRRADVAHSGASFAGAYTRLATAFGFHPPLSNQQFEALARLHSGRRDSDADRLLTWTDGSLIVDPDLERRIESRLPSDRGADEDARASLAAAFQQRLGELFVEFLSSVRTALGEPRLCVGGSFFYHSSINTLIAQSGLFDEVFVPIDPGDSGLAVGAARRAMNTPPALATPFLGPCYSPDEIKQTLHNCKLQYEWESEDGAIGAAVKALQQGYLVGWFDDSMEWGQRALGARCILANPMAPYVLENLNRFLKRREPWRGYALSVLQESTVDHFAGPPTARFMEYDYRPLHPAALSHVLPSSDAAIRLHTVDHEAGPPRFRRLLEAFRDATGTPFLVNTSFNGFHEPIVCNPRDAVRVFYGTGLDVLVLDRFVLGK
jgi:carbamoyltransferase